MAETLGVGLLGLGTVGSAVAARLMSEWELLAQRAGATPVLRRVAVRDATRKRDIDLRAVPITDDPISVVDDPTVSVVVEVMGGVDPATALIERALERGKSVEQDVFVRLHARDGEEGSVEEALREVAGPSRDEGGCLSFEMFRSARDPRLFYIHSRWVDEAAFQRHAELAHTVRFLKRVDSLLDEQRSVTRTERLE